MLVFLRLAACVTFLLFISQSLCYSKRSGNSNYPPSKEREGRREKPGGEKREGLTLETTLGFSKSRNKVCRDGESDRDEGRDECSLTDVLRCCYFTESFTPAKQNTALSTPFLTSTPQHFSIYIHQSLTESAFLFFLW